MKKTAMVFWSALGGVLVCFVMTVVTAVQQHRAQVIKESAPLSVPLPAEAPTNGGAAGITKPAEKPATSGGIPLPAEPAAH